MHLPDRRTHELDALAATLRPIFEKYGILKAIVFGSFARSDQSRRSDIDLVLIQNTEKRFLDRYDGILGDIALLVPGRAVDLLIYTPQEFVDMADRRFIQTIVKEGIVIYESDR
jgi:predicted nucleotidyltransferase